MKSENVFTLIRLPHSKLPNVQKLSTLFMDLYVLLKTNIKICNIYCKNTFNIIKSENVFNLSKVPHATFKFTDI